MFIINLNLNYHEEEDEEHEEGEEKDDGEEGDDARPAPPPARKVLNESLSYNNLSLKVQ